jgi:hypothetical protein
MLELLTGCLQDGQSGDHDLGDLVERYEDEPDSLKPEIDPVVENGFDDVIDRLSGLSLQCVRFKPKLRPTTATLIEELASTLAVMEGRESSSGKSDGRPKTADNESGAASPESELGLASFTIPSRIGESESNELQQQIQQLVPDFDEFYPKGIISYATGRRSACDVEGAGPGLYKAAAVIKALFKSDIPCFSGMMIPCGRNWREYFFRLEHADARVLVVLLSKAFFKSIPCLKEVHKAIEKKLVIVPVRVYKSGKGAIDIARDRKSIQRPASRAKLLNIIFIM